MEHFLFPAQEEGDRNLLEAPSPPAPSPCSWSPSAGGGEKRLCDGVGGSGQRPVEDVRAQAKESAPGRCTRKRSRSAGLVGCDGRESEAGGASARAGAERVGGDSDCDG
eukprot:80829-Hanusia_phi.AAC.1